MSALVAELRAAELYSLDAAGTLTRSDLPQRAAAQLAALEAQLDRVSETLEAALGLLGAARERGR